MFVLWVHWSHIYQEQWSIAERKKARLGKWPWRLVFSLFLTNKTFYQLFCSVFPKNHIFRLLFDSMLTSYPVMTNRPGHNISFKIAFARKIAFAARGESSYQPAYRAVWTESLLSAWRCFDPLATHRVTYEDWSDCCANAQEADVSICWAHMLSNRKCCAPAQIRAMRQWYLRYIQPISVPNCLQPWQHLYWVTYFGWYWSLYVW